MEEPLINSEIQKSQKEESKPPTVHPPLISAAYPQAGSRGFIVPSVKLTSISSSKFLQGGATNQISQVLSEQVYRLLFTSDSNSKHAQNDNLEDFSTLLDQLCIAKDKAVWVLYADLVCINYDGNILDAVLLALINALKDVKLPVATFDEELGVVFCGNDGAGASASASASVGDSNDGQKVSLQLKSNLYPTSFCVFSSGENKCLLVDPTELEEDSCDGSISLVLDDSGAIVNIWKLGDGVGTNELELCYERALQRKKELASML
ncbi:Exosome complex component RRP43 [Zancudomyces culisetae]|uniref:Ribosomal RNA-processing protein 43 n=1 Tax=Zancudomyces culisetae TaxID=1213189 RepID=A0A1R1PTC1_ZANCU|nr:Exosome complex component RRP43 [Zancudomyces culisetae]|eukprot:OMH84201.1 Exosome complex component RRP43 [Zancudomyces culisetae]